VPTLGLGWLDEAGGREDRLARAADTLVTNGRTGAAGVLFGPSETPGNEVVLGLGVARSAGGVAGLNVATDSIAPATRHTARMLASSGMTLPRAAKGANGPASRRSRFRRRMARSSRW
jgi:hypothetical protein